MEKYIQTDKLQKHIDWKKILKMERYAGGHDDQMKGLFKNVEVIAHWNEGDYQGMVATCIRFKGGEFNGKYAIYNDYYGSCSGCDSWENADDSDVKKLCIDLSNSAYLFNNINDVKGFLIHIKDQQIFSSWNDCALFLLEEINDSKTNK